MQSTVSHEFASQPTSEHLPAPTQPSLETLAASLSTDLKQGLTTKLAAERLVGEGANVFGKQKKTSIANLLWQQFTSSVVILLIVAASISAILHEVLQTGGIVAAIIINAAIGCITEYQARVSLEKLEVLTASTVRVRRDGVEHIIPSAELVRGDIAILQAGDRVPADLRLCSLGTVAVDESILTGESVSVSKSQSGGEEPTQNLLFQGTVLTSGAATGIVTDTGTNTRLGKLSVELAGLDTTATPLELQLDVLGRKLTVLTVALTIVFAVAGIVQGLSPLVMLETSIALAVAAIPEGLPVVATLSLALGIQRMVRHKALVRRLPAVEALGSASVICTDKTGTLTQNKMVVRELIACFDRYRFGGEGYTPIGEIEERNHPDVPARRGRLQQLLLPAVLCNDATLENHGAGWHVHGDPTEGALLVAGAKAELDQLSTQKTYVRVAELPFDLERKRMSVVCQSPAGVLTAYVKGSPDTVLSSCTEVLDGTKAVPIEQKHIEWIEQENKRLAEQGLRVLALAQKTIDSEPVCVDPEVLEANLTFVGLIAMHDPPKTGVQEALDLCRSAGIRVVMLTGDQPRTAFAVGKQLGICESESELISGAEVLSLSDGELSERLGNASVFARVTPELKLLLVRRLQQKGEVVAMTGDGVNDAPALKQANIGVAMGESGSDLAREAASLVITDDNFGTIVEAIAEGRQIYNKIRSSIGYLLSASLASLAVTGAGVFLREGLLLTPLQLLWLNLIMHVFACIGLVAQQNWDSLMSAPPRKPGGLLVDGPLAWQIARRAGVVTLVTLFGAWIDRTAFGGRETSSAALATLSSSLLILSWSWLKTERVEFSWSAIPTVVAQFKAMLLNTGIGYAMLFAALYLPGLTAVLETQRLPMSELSVLLGVSACAVSPFFLRRQ